MKLHTPHYYKNFSCLAGACRDNCCIGWEIDIDEAAYARYMAEPGPFGQRLRAHISNPPAPHFILQGALECCPFLNGQNLCDIHIALGEAALCRICTMHPRFTDQFGQLAELGLGIACEAAAQLILCNTDPFTLTVQQDAPPFYEEDAEDAVDPLLLEALLGARQQLITLLQDASLPLPLRLRSALLYAQALQAALEQDPASLPALCAAPIDPATLPSPLIYLPADPVAAALREAFSQLEYMDTAWLQAVQAALSTPLSSLQAAAPQVAAALPAVFMPNLAVYLLYRYFLKSLRDGDILGKVQLAAGACAVVYCLLAACPTPSLPYALRQAQLFSKEVEYSEDNLAVLADCFIDDPALCPLHLAALWEALLPQSI